MFNIYSDLIVYEADYFQDLRGEIYTIWKYDEPKTNNDFKHDKISYTRKNVLRGLHGDFSSTKMVTCVWGEVYYVFVDIRKDSETYLKWTSVNLSQKNKKIVIFPPGIATGSLTLSEFSVLSYKLNYENNYPDVDSQISLKWNDPSLNISWPIEDIILSERDK